MKKDELVSLIKEAQVFAKKNSGKDWRDLDESSLSKFLRNGSKLNDYDMLLDVVPEWGEYYDSVANMDSDFVQELAGDYDKPWQAPLKVVIVIEDYETGEADTFDFFDDYTIDTLLDSINKKGVN